VPVNPSANLCQLWIIFGCGNSQFDSKKILSDNSLNINFILMFFCHLLLEETEVEFALVGHFDHYDYFVLFFVILGEIAN